MCLDCDNTFVSLPNGSNGSNGKYGGYSSNWGFESQTTTSPSTGKIRFNNTTYSSITAIYVNETNASSTNLSAFLASFNSTDGGGFIRIFKEFDSNTFIDLKYISQTDAGTYRNIVVQYVANNGTFTTTDNLVLSFTSTGNAGEDAPPFYATTGFTFNQGTSIPYTSTYTFTLNPVLTSFSVGNSLRLTDLSNSLQYLEGIVTAYNTTTGSMTILLTNSIGGSWIATSFGVMITGRRGEDGIDGTDATIPVGVIMDYISTSAPANYMFCNGAAISRTTYTELFGVIGTTFGAGDGSTTFNLPDLRRRIRIGYDSSTSGNSTPSTPGEENYANLNNKGGVSGVTLAKGNIPAHVHKVETTPGSEGGGITVTNTVTNAAHSLIDSTANVGAGGTDVPDTWVDSNTSVSSAVTGTTGNGTVGGLKTSPDVVENRTKYIVLYPIIKVL